MRERTWTWSAAFWLASATLTSAPELIAPGYDCVFGPCAQPASAAEIGARAACYLAAIACAIFGAPIQACRELARRRAAGESSIINAPRRPSPLWSAHAIA